MSMTREIDLRSEGLQREEHSSRAAAWLVVLEIVEAKYPRGLEYPAEEATRHKNVVVRTVGRAPTSTEIHQIEESACAYHGALSARVTFFARLGD